MTGGSELWTDSGKRWGLHVRMENTPQCPGEPQLFFTVRPKSKPAPGSPWEAYIMWRKHLPCSGRGVFQRERPDCDLYVQKATALPSSLWLKLTHEVHVTLLGLSVCSWGIISALWDGDLWGGNGGTGWVFLWAFIFTLIFYQRLIVNSRWQVCTIHLSHGTCL